MQPLPLEGNRHRLLVIDDNPAIHQDFRKILTPARIASNLVDAETALFGPGETVAPVADFVIDSACQGQEGVELAQRAMTAGDPYALAFVDIRMPPGWDGVETIRRLWQHSPATQIVICTAYSDYSWETISHRLGPSDSLLILKKPFDSVEVLQLAHALSRKFVVTQQAKLRLADLDQLVEQQSSEQRLLERQLLHAQKMECIGQLAAGVAHDFNNLLTIVQGHASLHLGDPRLDPEFAESLNQIQFAAERATALTRQLLTFSRKPVTQSQRLDLTGLIRKTENLLRRLLGESAEFECRCETPLPPILGEESGIEQILMNLVVNARDASAPGGPIRLLVVPETIDGLAAQQRPQAHPGHYVRITVSDAGTGIPDHILPHIFEPFFTTKDVGKGTGLGLSTVYAIAKQHRGWIEVTSTVGVGTSFHVFLPTLETSPAIVTAGAAENAHSAPSAPAAGDPLQPGRTRPQPAPPPSPPDRETLLLVEDEAMVRNLVAKALRRQGYQVLAAENGADALRLWAEFATSIDLLITDVVLPHGMSGLEVARRLQADAPGLRTIFSSGYSSDLAQSDVALVDGINFLPKPYAIRHLLETVRRCLEAEEIPSVCTTE